MAEKTVIWDLCALCALSLRETLDLKEAKNQPVEQIACRMCRRKAYGTKYEVKYKTQESKGETE